MIINKNKNLWEPPESRLALESTPSRMPKTALLEGFVLGSVLGLIDIQITEWPILGSFLIYLGCGLVLGLKLGFWSFLAWPQLAVLLYAIHIAGIACGMNPPYVEASPDKALVCLGFLAPSGLGGLVGVCVRSCANRCILGRRRRGHPGSSSGAVDTEEAGEEAEAVLDPLLAVGEAVAAEEGAANAS